MRSHYNVELYALCIWLHVTNAGALKASGDSETVCKMLLNIQIDTENAVVIISQQVPSSYAICVY